MTLIDQHDLPQAPMAQKSSYTTEKPDTNIAIAPIPDTKVPSCLAFLQGLAESNLFYLKADFQDNTCSYQPGASFLLSLHRSAHSALY